MHIKLSESPLTGIEILIVEDSPTQAFQLKYLLEQNGYRVTAVGNGRLALDALSHCKPQIVISDINMPEMDGYALCHAIKSDKTLENIPVILVTSLTDLQGIMKGLECGADNFIRKPYDEKYLLARIDYLLMNRILRKNERVQMGIEIYLLGKRHFITVERQQMLDLLISIYEEAVHMNEELEARQQELSYSNQTLASLYRIADGLNGTVSEQDVVDRSVERTMEVPGIRACWIALCEGESGFRLAGVSELPLQLTVPAKLEEDCLCQRKLQSGELDSASIVADCDFIKHLGQDAGLKNQHISIPIRITDHSLGVLNLQYEGDRLLKDDELQTLQGIGNQIAMALVRARMHEQLEHLVQERTLALTEEIAEHKRTEHALRGAEERLDSILSSVTDVIWSISAQTHQLQYLNPAAERIYGRSLSDFFSSPGLCFEVVYPADKDLVIQYSNNLFSGVTDSLEYRIVKPNGDVRWLYDRGQLIYDAAGAPMRIDGITTDITELKQKQASILRLNRIYAVLSGINTSIVHIRDREQLLTKACQIAVQAGGFDLACIGMADMENRTIKPFKYAGVSVKYLEELENSSVVEATEGGEPLERAFRKKRMIICNNVVNDELMACCRQSMLRHNIRSVAAFPLVVMDQVVGVFALYASEQDMFDEQELKLLIEVAGDISYALENIEKERQLHYLACFDKVTDLPNRTLLNDRLGQLLPKIEHGNKNLAVLLLDIDRFKLINDSLGYQAGDMLLRKVAQRLTDVLQTDQSVSRGVADEFVITLSNVDDLADIAKFISETLVLVLSRPFEINSEELRITFKTGVSVFPGDADSAESLLKHAEVALDKAKRSMNTFLFYLPEMNASVSKILTIENKLHKAIERSEFVLHFQPKLDVNTSRVCGMEALIRWQDPESGLVPPMDFIPILEETGMILEVGLWVIETVCSYLRQWRDKGWAPPPVAVNVSSLQLAQNEFVDSVRKLLEKYDISGDLIEFEITESIIMQDVKASIVKLKALTELGSEISIDDFGTGYSSLNYLTCLPLSRLKIDKSFINGMTVSSDSLMIVSSVIALAHGLNLKVIAEGVETEEQLKLLKQLNCDEIQGYFAYRPLPLDKLEEVLTEERAIM